mgnify:CR=1 FL=1
MGGRRLRLQCHTLAMGTRGLGVIVSIVLGTEDGLTGGPDGMAVPPLELFGWVLRGERAWYWIAAGVLLATRGPSLVAQGDCVACIAHNVDPTVFE